MAQHLKRKHSDEKEVALAICHPPTSKKHRQILEELRRQGNYFHNIEVLQKGYIEIVTYRQPSQHADVEDYLPCNMCFGFFIKINYGDMRKCVVKRWVSWKLSPRRNEESKLLLRLFFHTEDSHRKGAQTLRATAAKCT